MVQQTSLLAFQEIKKDLGKRQKKVLAVLEQLKQLGGSATDKQLSTYLHWPINCITPRRNELVKKGLIVTKGTTLQDGRKAMLWATR